MKILVTGGAGYIGSHTVVELVERGNEVIVLDNLVKGHRQAVIKGKLIEGDILDFVKLDEVFSNNKIDAVMHFAADSLVGESVVNPKKYFNSNIIGSLNLLNIMLKYNIKYFIFSSTAAVYGEPISVPIEEEHPTQPTNPYGESKLALEKILRWYDQAYGLKYVSLRYFNAAGAHYSGEIGEDHRPETHLIPIVLQTALKQREYVEIFGDDYDTPDGTCIRDYIHVTDLAIAHILALEHLVKGGESKIYNLGHGKGLSVKEIIKVAEKVTGIKIPTKIGKRRPGDPAKLIASSKKIKKELNWVPQNEDINIIIESAWKWHKNHPAGFPPA